PESLAVRLSNPVLSELIGRRAPRADDRALACIAANARANLQDETVRRAGLRGAARLKQRCQHKDALLSKLIDGIDHGPSKRSNAVHLYDRFRLRPCEVRHGPWHKPIRSEFQWFQCRPVKTASHPERPTALHDDNMLVGGMGVWQNDIASVIVNSNHKELTRP